MSRYVKIQNNSITVYTLEEFLSSHIGANICDIFTGEISEKLLANYGLYILNEVIKPEEEEGYVVEEGSPECIADTWVQTWIKKKLNTK